MEKKYTVLLYYCYTPIDDAESFRESHHLLCLKLNLRGRIIVAPEGLNGTVSGLKANCEAYMRTVRDMQGFESIEFKSEPVTERVFAKLHVRTKTEIVNSGLEHIDPNEKTGKYIEPQEFRDLLRHKDGDTVILDVRSDYEHNVGKFKGAVTLDIHNFREFPEKIKGLQKFKSKKIVTYCTGGIKCEKASAYLLEQGFENVYQLHGGIIKYGLETGGEDFEGKCYVFDNRIVQEVNHVNPTVISRCYITGKPTDRMINCANPECNLHVPMSEEGAEVYNGCCSEECMNHPEVRKYSGSGYYQRKTNGYNPYKGLKRNPIQT